MASKFGAQILDRLTAAGVEVGATLVLTHEIVELHTEALAEVERQRDQLTAQLNEFTILVDCPKCKGKGLVAWALAHIGPCGNCNGTGHVRVSRDTAETERLRGLVGEFCEVGRAVVGNADEHGRRRIANVYIDRLADLLARAGTGKVRVARDVADEKTHGD